MRRRALVGVAAAIALLVGACGFAARTDVAPTEPTDTPAEGESPTRPANGLTPF